eukprot:347696-Chlamydomonas_euryale.AAC.2
MCDVYGIYMLPDLPLPPPTCLHRPLLRPLLDPAAPRRPADRPRVQPSRGRQEHRRRVRGRASPPAHRLPGPVPDPLAGSLCATLWKSPVPARGSGQAGGCDLVPGAGRHDGNTHPRWKGGHGWRVGGVGGVSGLLVVGRGCSNLRWTGVRGQGLGLGGRVMGDGSAIQDVRVDRTMGAPSVTFGKKVHPGCPHLAFHLRGFASIHTSPTLPSTHAHADPCMGLVQRDRLRRHVIHRRVLCDGRASTCHHSKPLQPPAGA